MSQMNNRTCVYPYAIRAQLSWQHHGPISCSSATVAELALCSEGALLPAKTYERLGNISGPFA